jgi:hypothetical protein
MCDQGVKFSRGLMGDMVNENEYDTLCPEQIEVIAPLK